MLQEVTNRQNFQGRYVLRHPYTEPAACHADARKVRLSSLFEFLLNGGCLCYFS
jgi:hypothetical protein